MPFRLIEVISMKKTFKKEERLCSKSDIDALFHSSSSFVVYPYRVVYTYLPADIAAAKVIISVSKRRFKKAHDRNRIKRLMREAYRLQKHALWQQVSTMKSENGAPLRMELAFVWLAEETLPYAKVYERMGRLLEKIQASLS